MQFDFLSRQSTQRDCNVFACFCVCAVCVCICVDTGTALENGEQEVHGAEKPGKIQ